MLKKSPTGIDGFDEITAGGLPNGRTTLVCGSAGCGKTLFAMQFLVQGAVTLGEPGVFVSFEEAEEELIQNFSSLGFDLSDLIERNQIAIDHVLIERGDIEATGAYNLEGLFIRLSAAVDQVGAGRVVLDSIEALFSGVYEQGILRSELRRLFQWLKGRGLTALVTGERGADQLTRYGLEEYVADCVVVIDHRVQEQVSTRRLRIVKYRGSVHGADEYPFLIHDHGISLMPVTSSALNHVASHERIRTGIEALDGMLEGAGYYRGSSVLVSGSSGTGKTTIAAHFAAACCSNGEEALFLAFEESPSQIVRNMGSVGIDLGHWVDCGLLTFHAVRPTQYGLEYHLARILHMVGESCFSAAVIDPISNLMAAGSPMQAKAMLLRLIDELKMRGITTLCTDLTHGGISVEQTELGVSSLMDTWLVLRSDTAQGEHKRTLYIVKSRGMKHVEEQRPFRLTNRGFQLSEE